jgi:hypothetical protein
MTRERKHHVAAISLLVAGLVAGAVCWALSGVAFWVVCGVAVALVLVGLYFGSVATAEQRPRQEEQKPGGRDR